MRRSLTVAIAAGAVIGAAFAPAAAFASPDATSYHQAAGPAPGGDPDTTLTFTVTSGALTMTAPGSANLGSGAPGTNVGAPIGLVTVTDNRALLSAAWTATASSTDFANGANTIPATDANYDAGAVTHTGTITVTATDITLAHTPQTVVAGTAGSGDNSASWNPTISVAIPAAAVGGTYTATLVQSVS